MKSRVIVLIGTVMYVLAWFLPVHRSLGSSMVPGWEAFRIAVWPYGGSDPWYAGLHYAASALSNIVLIGALALVLVVLNTHWFVLSENRGDLRIGYYLWASSFVLITAGLALEARRAGVRDMR